MGQTETFLLLCLLGLISTVSSLECYACRNQDNNKDKCAKTTKQCEEYEDTCVSYVGWQVPPYWTPRGERINFISKDCIQYDRCEQLKREHRVSCKRDWYNDWNCVECCQGDLCNYYVTMGSGLAKATLLPLVITLCVLINQHIL